MSPIDKDLRFKAKKAISTENQLDRIKLINEGFKLSGILCRLVTSRNSLTIRYTDLDGNRKNISPPNCDLTPFGIHQAENTAMVISQALRLRNYSAEWLDTEIFHKTDKVKPIVLTAGMVKTEFGDRWMKYRSGDKESTHRQKQRTLGYYMGYINQLYELGKVKDSDPYNAVLISKLLNIYAEGEDRKFRAKETLSVISTIFGIDYNYKGIAKRPKAKKREIPNDIQILTMYEKFDLISFRTDPKVRDYYKWVFSIIATYGIRPQEIYAIDLEKSFKADTSYWLFLEGSKCEGIKTGDRAVPPLHNEWIELLNVTKTKSRSTSAKDIGRLADQIAQFFRRHRIGCKPYDLRHAYAIRGDKVGKPLVAMARAMGHDVATHVKIYQKWISIEDQIESFNRTN
jgi:integrase